MVKFLLTADLHGSDRTDEELHWSLHVWDHLLTTGRKLKVDAVIITGDIIHYKYGLSARLLLHISRMLQDYPKPVIILPGNHDIPWPTSPEDTVLELIAGAKVLTKPFLWVLEEAILAFMPWRPPDSYQDLLHQLTLEAMKLGAGRNKKAFLFSHVALHEGHVSSSNIRITTPIRAHHLYLDTYDHVFLGDYHARQQIKNITYIGAPRPRTHGDYDNKGFMTLTIPDSGAWTVGSVDPHPEWPQYITRRVQCESDFPLPKGRPQDKIRVYAPLEMMRWVQETYPNYKVQVLEGVKIKQSDNRLGDIESLDPWNIFTRWLKIRGYTSKIYQQLGRQYIEEIPEKTSKV